MELVASLKKKEDISRPRIAKRVLIPIGLMQGHGICAGDLVRLSLATDDTNTDKPSIAFGAAWPSFTENPEEIQLSAITMSNCAAMVGNRIKVEPVRGRQLPLPVAQSVTIRYTANIASADYAKEILLDVGVVRQGQLVDITANGLSQHIHISKIMLGHDANGLDTDAVVVHKETEIIVSDASNGGIAGNPAQNQIPVPDVVAIGGLDAELTSVRQIVGASLNEPHIFAQNGLQAPRGVLLYGPPGTGKTLLARSVASESQAHVIVINGAEVVGKFYGDAEERLRSIFDEARRRKPSIIFMDEVDALCPRRSDRESESSARVVSTVLSLLDDVGDRVVVIGATNRPDAIDPALRRPGRLDREIEIPIPSPAARLQILQTKLAGTTHTLDAAQINTLASKTHGYVGADVDALVREAAVIAVRSFASPTHQLQTQPTFNGLHITFEHLESAIKVVTPSTMREVALEIPNVRWEDIGGQHQTKQLLKESVEWPLKHPEAFTRMGIRPPKGVLLYGPPGCSKTLTAKALATEAGLNFIAVRGPELFSKWVGESEKAVREVFRKARAAAPSIVFFDEIDALTVARGSAADGTSVADRVLSQLLTELDGIEPLVNVTVVAATNRPDVIDPAILRPDRIDRLIYVGPPDLPTRSEILRLQLAKIPCSMDVGVDELARLTDGFSGAEVVALCQDAAIEAMDDSVDAECVEMRHFSRCLTTFKKRITAEMLQFYDKFKNKSR